MFLGFFQKLDLRLSILSSFLNKTLTEMKNVLFVVVAIPKTFLAQVMGEKPTLQPINSKFAATYSLSPTSTSRPSIIKNNNDTYMFVPAPLPLKTKTHSRMPICWLVLENSKSQTT
jgi:hypothetical protein